jgi:hypothetical protein
VDGVLSLLPGGSPYFVPILEVLTLRQLLLSEVALHHRVAVLIDLIVEVLVGHADHFAFRVLPCAFIDVVPCLFATPESVRVY